MTRYLPWVTIVVDGGAYNLSARPTKELLVDPDTDTDKMLSVAMATSLRIEVDGEAGWFVSGRRPVHCQTGLCVGYTLSPPIGGVSVRKYVNRIP